MRVPKLSAVVVIVGTIVLAGASVRAVPVTVDFGSTGDNFMYSGTAAWRNSNWGTFQHILAGPNTGHAGAPYRGLLHTDLSALAALPSVAVQSATLTLTVSDVAKRGTLAVGESYEVELYLLDNANADWWEGDGNADPVDGASSWNYLAYHTNSAQRIAWAGGDGIGTSTASPGLSTLLGTATIYPNAGDPNAMQIGDKVSFNITSPEGLAAVQSWATGGTNAGFFLKTSLDTGTTNAHEGAVYFGSKENTTAARRPALSVDFTTPAVGHYRFEDATSANGDRAADFLGLNHGTYQGTVSLSSDTPAALPSSTQSISLGGSGHVDLTTLSGMGDALNGEGIVFDFWAKTEDTARTRMFGAFNSGDQTAVVMSANTNDWTQTAAGTTSLFLRSTAGQINAYFDTSDVNIYDGDWHHVVWAINDPLGKGLSSAFDSSVFTLTVNGSPIPLTYTTSGFSATATFNEFDHPFRIGAAGRATYFNERFVGQFDSFTISSTTPIALGDVIGVDLSAAGGSATSFNVFSSNGTIEDGTVVRYSDGSIVHGVSLSFSGASGFNNDVRAQNWPGAASDPYYSDSAAWDLAYASGAGSELILTFAGLDDSLSYDVSVYALFGAFDDREETITVTDGLGTQSSTENRGFRWGADTLEDAGLVFTDLKTDGLGNLVVTVTGPVGNNPFLNAVVLRAVPEPGAVFMLLLAGLAALGIRRRVRR